MDGPHRQRSYDHRLKQLVHSTGNIQIALDCGVPRSTARGWLRSPPCDVVSAASLELDAEGLRRELFDLREHNRKLAALLRLFVVLAKVLGCTLVNRRLPA